MLGETAPNEQQDLKKRFIEVPEIIHKLAGLSINGKANSFVDFYNGYRYYYNNDAML